MTRPLFLAALALGTAVATTPAGAQPSTLGGGDRYGPAADGVPASPPYGDARRTAAGAVPDLRGRVLSWPGKVEARPAAPSTRAVFASASGPAYAWQGYAPSAAYAGRSVRTPADPQRVPTRVATSAPSAWRTWTPPKTASTWNAPSTSLAGAPSDGWRPVFAAAPAGAPAPPAAPTSIYTAPGPGYSPTLAAARAVPPNRALAADRRYGYDPTQDHSVRVYSVARPFGLKPDPAPIPPQFFTATADLGGDPPGPLPINHATATDRAAIVGGGGDSSGAGAGTSQ